VFTANLRHPAASQASNAHIASGLWNSGTSGFGRTSVNGRNRVPSPAPRINACVIIYSRRFPVRELGGEL